MPLRIETIRSLESRRVELGGETVQADYSSQSTKAIKDHILTNFGFWSKRKVGDAMDHEQVVGSGTLGRLGAALARKPMGAEGDAVLEVLKRVNEKTLSVTNALAEIGRLERQHAANHANVPDQAARAFFMTARKVALMAPMVAVQMPAKSKEAPKAIADIASQYERLERVFDADTLKEVDELRSLYNWQMKMAEIGGNAELVEATHLLLLVLDSKRAILQELANISDRLTNGIPNARTMQDASSSLESFAQVCLSSHGKSGELHDLGHASLIGAVQKGLTQFYGVTHQRDLARVAALQAQLDQVDFGNDLTVDMTSVNGLAAEVTSIDDKWYSQAMKDAITTAAQKLQQSAQMKMLVVRLRNLEKDFDERKNVGSAQLMAILQDAGKLGMPEHEAATWERIKTHAQILLKAMNDFSVDHVREPLGPLQKELEAATGVEQVRDCVRRIEAELKTQMDFLTSPNTPVSPEKMKTLSKELMALSSKAIVKECNLALEAIDAGSGHTLQEVEKSLSGQAHLNQNTLTSVQSQLKEISQKSQKTVIDELSRMDKPIQDFFISKKLESADMFARLQSYEEQVNKARSDASRTMLVAEQTAVEAKCSEVEKALAEKFGQAMMMLPSEERINLRESDMEAVGELGRLGGFDKDLGKAILKLGQENPKELRDLADAVNAHKAGKPGSDIELFKKLDKLLEREPATADALLRIKLGLANKMDEKKIRLLHEASVAHDTFDRLMDEPAKNETMKRLGLYYFKGVTTNQSLRYMLGKVGLAGRNRPVGLNMAILKHLWMDELTREMTDDSPLPDVKARFAEFQAKLPEPFKSDRGLFTAMAFDAKELRFVEDFGKALAKLSQTMDGARELQAAFDACIGQDDVFAARKALESLTRRYADCASATGDQLMQNGTRVREGLFAACESLPDELASAFQIEGEPTEEQNKAIAAFAEKAEGLRSTSALLTIRAKRQELACNAVIKNVTDYKATMEALMEANGKTFKPNKVHGATVAVCILATKAAVQGMKDDLANERHSSEKAVRDAAKKRLDLRVDLLRHIIYPSGMQLSSMTSSRFNLDMDEEANTLFNLRGELNQVNAIEDPERQKTALLKLGQKIEQFLADGDYVKKAEAVLAFKKQDKDGSAQEIWDHAYKHAGLDGDELAAAREMVNLAFPQQIAGSAVRATKAEKTLTKAAQEDFEAAKKSLDETTRAFSTQVRKALMDAVRIAVADAFLRSDPPLGSVAALKARIPKDIDLRTLQEMPFLQQCLDTMCTKLSVPKAVAINLLIQFLPNIDDGLFQNMTKGVSSQGAQTFLMDLSAADRAPVERLLHREETLRRTNALISSMTEPEAMVTFDLGMTQGTTVQAVAGLVFSGKTRQEQALQADMAIRREGPEFVVTLSPNTDENMGKLVKKALVELENAAALGQMRDGLELHFENGEKCAQFLADLLSGELEMSSFQTCSGVDLLAREGSKLKSHRIDIDG